jgi:hypothetical protein
MSGVATKQKVALSKNREIEIYIDPSISSKTMVDHFAVGVVSSVILYTSVLSIAHTAAIMEQSESTLDRNYILDRMEKMLVGDFLTQGNKLILNRRLSNPDHKKQYSEVWGVGCGIQVMAKLLGTKPQYTITISKSGMRMDFFTFKGKKRYIYETKGTSCPITIKPVNSIVNKKSVLKGLSFGTVTRAVRNGKEVKVEVYDPPVEVEHVLDDDLILCILRHYTKLCFLSGFIDLAEELSSRVKKIEKDMTTIEEFKNKPITVNNLQTKSLHLLDTEFLLNHKHGKFIFGIEKTIFQAIKLQDYNKLLNYELFSFSSQLDTNEVEYSVHEDGSILMVNFNELKDL